MSDKRARDLGELIARRMMEKHPDVVNGVRNLIEEKFPKKPWYVRAYDYVKRAFYG